MEEIDFIQPKKIVGKLISTDVLDKIRAEIKTMGGDIETISDVLDIIDKYKMESEE